MSHERIPENPKDNLKRMESILSAYRRKLEHKKKVSETTQSKLDRLREVMVGDSESDSVEARSRQVIERKYLYDLSKLVENIDELDGQIIWAEQRQIPFIKTEIKLAEEDEEDKEDKESAVCEEPPLVA
ncbi:MAG: hypothetical protein GOU98_02275 [Candidatus Altiarchaeota archaeon]|nr:hypothetical protein [Candidatus Altiarchaeota archaeon]